MKSKVILLLEYEKEKFFEYFSPWTADINCANKILRRIEMFWKRALASTSRERITGRPAFKVNFVYSSVLTCACAYTPLPSSWKLSIIISKLDSRVWLRISDFVFWMRQISVISSFLSKRFDIDTFYQSFLLVIPLLFNIIY